MFGCRADLARGAVAALGQRCFEHPRGFTEVPPGVRVFWMAVAVGDAALLWALC